jgi:hypothetical protein
VPTSHTKPWIRILPALLGARLMAAQPPAVPPLPTEDCGAAPAAAGQALPGAPTGAEAWYAQALCLRSRGRLREALAGAVQALRLSPGFGPAQRLRQELESQMQAGACSELCRAADQDRALGRLAQAQRGYRLALRLDPGCTAAQEGLAALGPPRPGPENVWPDADRANPGSAQAQGLRALLAASRGVDGHAALGEAPALWSGFLRAGLQQSDRAAPPGDQDSAEAVLFGRVARQASSWAAAYAYFLDSSRSNTGTARVDYHALSLQWSPRASAWSLLWDEAMEWSQGQPAYWHHLAEIRKEGLDRGVWRGWIGLQVLWENYSSSPELDTFGPSMAAGMAGPLPGGGRLGLELRLRADDTQSWDDRDGVAGAHASLLWRAQKNFSPRLDLDAKAQDFPAWPGGPGRWDHSLDARLEWTLWQDGPCQFSVGDEAWDHASTSSDYSEIGNSVFTAGTILW